MGNGEDDSSNSDSDQKNKNIDHTTSVGYRGCCLPNWLCTALCCFGYERGDFRRQTPQPAASAVVPGVHEPESGDAEESESEEEVGESLPAELPLSAEDLAYLKQEQAEEADDEEEVVDDGRMHAWVGASNYESAAQSAAASRKLIRKLKGKLNPSTQTQPQPQQPPPPPPPTNNTR